MSQDWEDVTYTRNERVHRTMEQIDDNFASLKTTFYGNDEPPHVATGMMYLDATDHWLKIKKDAGGWVKIVNTEGDPKYDLAFPDIAAAIDGSSINPGTLWGYTKTQFEEAINDSGESVVNVNPTALPIASPKLVVTGSLQPFYSSPIYIPSGPSRLSAKFDFSAGTNFSGSVVVECGSGTGSAEVSGSTTINISTSSIGSGWRNLSISIRNVIPNSSFTLQGYAFALTD